MWCFLILCFWIAKRKTNAPELGGGKCSPILKCSSVFMNAVLDLLLSLTNDSECEVGYS